jgi:hypothetical protein
MLGYAITGHKTLGATISSKVMIHIRESFARGLMYVMLSRVRSQKNLKIVNNLQPLHIQPMLPWFLENVNIVINRNTNTYIIVVLYALCAILLIGFINLLSTQCANWTYFSRFKS